MLDLFLLFLGLPEGFSRHLNYQNRLYCGNHLKGSVSWTLETVPFHPSPRRATPVKVLGLVRRARCCQDRVHQVD